MTSDDLLDGDALAFERWKDRVWQDYFARHGTAEGFPEHLHRVIKTDPEGARLFADWVKLQSPGGRLQ
jgi:hypothetical protein